MNVGNPEEHTVLEVAELALEVTGSDSSIVFSALPLDDPIRRCPDITLAGTKLGWKPEVTLRDGLTRTGAWYRSQVGVGS